MRYKGMTAGEILDAHDDGRVWLMDRSQFLLMQIREDKQKGLIKRKRLIDKTKRDITRARKENPDAVPKLKENLEKLQQKQREELRFETIRKEK